MIFLKTDDEIELLRQSNLLVGRTLAEVAKMIQPGVTTKQLDKVADGQRNWKELLDKIGRAHV